jgi:hypothetical protein
LRRLRSRERQADYRNPAQDAMRSPLIGLVIGAQFGNFGQ